MLTALLALFEAVLLYAVFIIAEWIWPKADLIDPPLSLSRKRSETSPPASGFAAQGEKAGACGKTENKECG